jgi:uncharacterized protein YjiS (DUF1127 family)
MSKLTKMLNASNDSFNTKKKVNFFSGVNSWIRVNGITKTLSQLDDHTLEDLDISRGEIRAYAQKMDAIQNTANTNKTGVEKVFIHDLKEALLIRTNEAGDAALK